MPTVLVGSDGLLRAGATLYEHANGYDLLRTVEQALRVSGLGRFDTYARPLSEIFAGGAGDPAARLLWPSESVATRGSIADTFGRSGTPAAVLPGEPLTLVVPAGVGPNAGVSLEPLGQAPTGGSTVYGFGADRVTVSIPTDSLPAGAVATVVALREGSNPIVRYCLPAGLPANRAWIGIFPEGTPRRRMTKANANRIGYWLRTPESPCGEAQAYASEMAPGHSYQIRLFQERADGASKPVGHAAPFTVTPSLPR